MLRDRLVGAWHATDLRPVLGAGAAAAVLVAIAGWRADGEAGRLVTIVLPCAGLLAVALTTAVDERPSDLLAASPTTLRRRLLTRLAVVAALVGVVAVSLAVELLALAHGEADWPWGTWALQLCVIALLATGLAAQGRRWFPGLPGGMSAAAVLGLLWLAALLFAPPAWVRDALDALPQHLAAGALAAAGGGLLWWATADPAQVILRARTR
jgi:hypothetical protein